MTLAILQASGKVPVEKIKLNSSVRGCDNTFLNDSRIMVWMLFIPIAFLSFKDLGWSFTSALVGVRKKVLFIKVFLITHETGVWFWLF